MIRVPTIAINRPWPSFRARKRVSSPADVQLDLEKEVAQQRLQAAVDREKADVFSEAFLTGRLHF